MVLDEILGLGSCVYSKKIYVFHPFPRHQGGPFHGLEKQIQTQTQIQMQIHTQIQIRIHPSPLPHHRDIKRPLEIIILEPGGLSSRRLGLQTNDNISTCQVCAALFARKNTLCN